MLSVNDWKKQKDLLAAALLLNAGEREKLLAGSDIDAETRAEIESFLKLEIEAGDFLSVPASGFSGDFFVEENNGHLPAQCRLGFYEIVAELGSGGMGAVYLGKRTDGKFEQKVAIKMLKREFNVEKIRQTFRREKEILSKLNHPNIAGLLDAGTTDDGIPYLVMEYVAGKPIDKFCENENLPLKARLKLFNKICEAVSFAHRNLIVHRDLKPSNILVNEKGEPKLLDFGISKLLDAEENTSITAFGAMTPEYASPEQIRGETVSTATDIYSLGLVLYKILTNAHPFDLKGKTNGQVLKTITENEPMLPSKSKRSAVSGGLSRQTRKTKIEDSTDSVQPPATAGGSDISASKLKGDLDNIILKSLRKKPERRYETVEQFAADIWRYIDGLPILARPATLSYRASKFFRRNKIAVIAGIIVFLSLITGFAVAIWQADVARRQADFATKMQSQAEKMRSQSELETIRAKSEEEKAKKISQFMFKVISYANPAWYAEGARFGGRAQVIDALEDLSDKIDTEFAAEADVAAELHHKFSEVFVMAQAGETAGRIEKLEQKQKFHALRALELRKEFYGERHELVAKDLYYASAFIGKNDSEHAAVLAEAIEMMRETNPKNLNLPYMLADYAAALILPKFEMLHEIYRKAARPATDENEYAIAERYLREALAIFRFHYKEDNYAIFMNECVLAYTLAKQENQTDFDEHYGICKQGEEKLKTGNSAEAMRNGVELVEKALAEKNQPK